MAESDTTPPRFERTDLRGARFEDVDLTGARFQAVNLSGAVLRGVEMVGARIDGYVDDLTVNGVEVMPLVQAELDRRHPDRVKMRPTDPEGFREAWVLLEQLWSGTVERAKRLPPGKVHESVDGEWSFVETLRHLMFATDAWIARVMLGDPEPWHPLDLPFDQMPDMPGLPRDRSARPDLDTVLELREVRFAMVRRVLDDLTAEQLASRTEPVEGPAWPPPDRYPVAEILRNILNEEWQHRLYAERDLTALER
jgi:uncharacterized protein YjbI with pentapeptide repeats